VPFSITPDEARTIPRGASETTSNRWSGKLTENISRGALYTSLDPISLANEALRYSREKITEAIDWKGSSTGKAEYTRFGPRATDFRQLLVNRIYFVFTLLNSIEVVNLSPSISRNFFDRIESDSRYRKASEALGVMADLSRLVFDPIDFTASLPVGLAALLATSTDGIKVETAQHETAAATDHGGNVVLGGGDGHSISSLQPTGRLIEGSEEGRPALLELPISIAISHNDSSIIVPGSVLSTDGSST
jgi:hypothetical protein